MSLTEKVKHCIAHSIPLNVKTYTIPQEMEQKIEVILKSFLSELEQEELFDHIFYCLRELAVNAQKANTKRAYFSENDLDIQNPDHYKKGMVSFKNDTLNDVGFWWKKQEEMELYIRFSFLVQGTTFKITIKNNVEITPEEQMRIFDKIARSRVYGSVEDAFKEILDDTEGAGLGIVILILMLRKIGLSEEAFEIEGGAGMTTASLKIPYSELKLEKYDMLTSKIVNEISQLPQFPENIAELQRLLSNPDVQIADLARRITMDPSLTADILRITNSAQFVTQKRVESIPDAIKLLGLRGLKNMLYSYGAETILQLPEKKQLWDHSHKAAFFSFSLAKNLTRRKDQIDDAYIGGILHDIGKIVFSAAHPSLLENIEEFSKQKKMNSKLVEDMAAGFNHAEVGARVAEKWNFSPILIDSIRYHHSPEQAPGSTRLVVYCVYLGNMLAVLGSGDISYDQISGEVLKVFGIQDKDQILEIAEKLEEAYNREKEK